MFATGGLVGHGDLFAGRAATERKIIEAFAMPPEMLDPKRGRVSVVLSMPQKSRKKPITDDMAQMCADLKIEPRITFADAFAEVGKSINRLMMHQLYKDLFDDSPYPRKPVRWVR